MFLKQLHNNAAMPILIQTTRQVDDVSNTNSRLRRQRFYRRDFKDFQKKTLPPALTLSVEQGSTVLMATISTIISSQLGDAAIAAIGSVSTITFTVTAIFTVLSTGGTIAVAQYMGRRDRRRINETAAYALFLTSVLAVGVVLVLLAVRRPLIQFLFGEANQDIIELAIEYFTVLCFYYLPYNVTTTGLFLLRGEGDMRSALKISLISNVINLALSYPLIYGFAPTDAGEGFGVRGAAASMLIAQVAGALLVLWMMTSGGSAINIRGINPLRVEPSIRRNLFRMGTPAGIEQILFAGGRLFIQIFVMSLGTSAIAANSIMNSLYGPILIIGSSYATLATTLVGQQVGAGKKRRARLQLIYLWVTMAVFYLFVSLILFGISPQIIGLYTRVDETIVLGSQLLRSYLIALPFLYPPAFILPGGLRGAGDVRYSMVVTVAAMWTMRVGLSYVLAFPLNLGIYGIFAGMYADWALRGLCFIRRVLGSKWLDNTVSD